MLYELEGLTSPEIAELLQIPLGSVASRLRRAREQFRAAAARIEKSLRRKEGQSHEAARRADLARAVCSGVERHRLRAAVLEAALQRAALAGGVRAHGPGARAVSVAATVAAPAAAKRAGRRSGGDQSDRRRGTAVWPWVSRGRWLDSPSPARRDIATRALRSHDRRPASGGGLAVAHASAPELRPSPWPHPAPEPSLASARGTRQHATATGDLSDQVALLDAARAAVSAGRGPARAGDLAPLPRQVPDGQLPSRSRPRIKVEALMKLGREAEARALAERFVAEHRGTLLARRVAEIAGSPQP